MRDAITNPKDHILTYVDICATLHLMSSDLDDRQAVGSRQRARSLMDVFARGFDSARVRSDLEMLCAPDVGGRASGTPGHARVAGWLIRRLTALGLEVSTQAFPADGLIDVYASPMLELAGAGKTARALQVRSDIAVHPRSADLPDPLVGTVVDVPGAGDKTWVLVDPFPRGPGLETLAKDLKAIGVLGLLALERAGEHGYLAKRVIDDTASELPVLVVRRELASEIIGQTARIRVPVRRRSGRGLNLVARPRQSQSARSPVLLSAHYDGVGDDDLEMRLPGAADNASGVAVLLEVGRLLAALPRLRVPVWIALLDAEEANAQGSRAHAQSLLRSGIRPLAINLDMAGRLGDAVSVEPSPAAQDLIAALDRVGRRERIPLELASVASDNRRYAAAGFASVGLSLGGVGYHTPADRPDSVEDGALRTAARLIFGLIAELRHLGRTSAA
jgi:aminopeptidase YwaD